MSRRLDWCTLWDQIYSVWKGLVCSCKSWLKVFCCENLIILKQFGTKFITQLNNRITHELTQLSLKCRVTDTKKINNLKLRKARHCWQETIQERKVRGIRAAEWSFDRWGNNSKMNIMHLSQVLSQDKEHPIQLIFSEKMPWIMNKTMNNYNNMTVTST